jgi:hypothetical protein
MKEEISLWFDISYLKIYFLFLKIVKEIGKKRNNLLQFGWKRLLTVVYGELPISSTIG